MNFFSWNAVETSIFVLAALAFVHNRCQLNHFTNDNCQPFEKNASYNPALSTSHHFSSVVKGSLFNWNKGLHHRNALYPSAHILTLTFSRVCRAKRRVGVGGMMDNLYNGAKSLLNCPALLIFCTCLFCACCHIKCVLTTLMYSTHMCKYIFIFFPGTSCGKLSSLLYLP